MMGLFFRSIASFQSIQIWRMNEKYSLVENAATCYLEQHSVYAFWTSCACFHPQCCCCHASNRTREVLISCHFVWPKTSVFIGKFATVEVAFRVQCTPYTSAWVTHHDFVIACRATLLHAASRKKKKSSREINCVLSSLSVSTTITAI